MNKNIFFKKLIGVFSYIIGIALFIYLFLIVQNGKFIFSMLGIIITFLSFSALMVIFAYGTIDSHKNNKKKIIKFIVCHLFAFYIFILYSVLFQNSFRIDFAKNASTIDFGTYCRYNTNLIPLLNIFYSAQINARVVIRNIIGNVLAFIPMSIFTLYLFSIQNKNILFAFTNISIIFCVEFLQFVTRRGVFDIDDIIFNLIGVLLGYVIYKYVKIYVKSKQGINMMM